MPRGANKACSDDQFVTLVSTLGATGAATQLGVSPRSVAARRKSLSDRGVVFPPAPFISAGRPNPAAMGGLHSHPGRVDLHVMDGCVIVGSDAHYWPDIVSTAHRGFVEFTRQLKPKFVILNGDVLDGAGISRHPPLPNWEKQPDLIDEIEACQQRLTEIRKAAKGAELVWTLGNHDARFTQRLATVAPQYAKINGIHLKDHFPDWKPAFAAWVNGSVVIKHRYKGGVHATHNNTVNAGLTIVTGHLHSLKVTPFRDYNGTRWGVDTGTLADPYGPQFHYSELNPLNHESGFVVLTFKGGELLQPEIARVCGDGRVDFRGSIVHV